MEESPAAGKGRGRRVFDITPKERVKAQQPKVPGEKENELSCGSRCSSPRRLTKLEHPQGTVLVQKRGRWSHPSRKMTYRGVGSCKPDRARNRRRGATICGIIGKTPPPDRPRKKKQATDCQGKRKWSMPSPEATSDQRATHVKRKRKLNIKEQNEKRNRPGSGSLRRNAYD